MIEIDPNAYFVSTAHTDPNFETPRFSIHIFLLLSVSVAQYHVDNISASLTCNMCNLGRRRAVLAAT